MPLPSEESLRSTTRVLSIVAAVALVAAAGWFCFQHRDVQLADIEWNPVRLYFRLVTGERHEDVAAKSLEQPAFKPVFAYDRDALQIDPELIKNLNGPARSRRVLVEPKVTPGGQTSPSSALRALRPVAGGRRLAVTPSRRSSR